MGFIVLGGCEKSPVQSKGISLKGGYIDCSSANDELDLESVVLAHDVALRDCTVNGTINLLGASVNALKLDGTAVEGLVANRLDSTDSVFLRNGFQSTGPVRLMGAKIGSSLYCSGGRFLDSEKALICDRLETAGSVFLREGFESVGEVRLAGARIARGLSCSDARLGSGIEIRRKDFLRYR